MKALRDIPVLVFLLMAASSQCFAVWDIELVSKERANELGLEIRSKAAGPTQVSVELEIKTEGELKNFSREGGVRQEVELQIKEGETVMVSAALKEDRSKAGRVVVRFAAERSQLDKILLRVWGGYYRGGGVGGAIYELRVKDFIEQETSR